MNKEVIRHIAVLIIGFIGLTASAQDVYVNIENDAVRRYISEVTYTSIEDSSLIDHYNVSPPSRRDVPVAANVPVPNVDADTVTVTYALESDFSDGTTIGVQKGQTRVSVYNLVPKSNYYYKVEADSVEVAKGRIHTTGQVRMIYVPGTYNLRDLGGWPTADGKLVKYGKIYRGADLNGTYVVDSADIEMLKQLGISAEIDMRAYYNEGSGISAFGFTSSGSTPTYYYTNNSGQLPEHLLQPMFLTRWCQSFQFIVSNLRAGRAIYTHCVYGADRTGYLSFLLEGLLGVTYDGMIKDYELTTFFAEDHVKSRIEPVVEYIKTLNGATLQEKFNYFFTHKMGVSQADIDYFRSEMLVEEKHEGGGTAVKSPEVREVFDRVGECFDLMGRKVSESKRGLMIQVGSDGKPRKVIR